ELKQLEARIRNGRRKLETVGGHVAVSTRASIAMHILQFAIEEVVEASSHGRARFSAAVAHLLTKVEIVVARSGSFAGWWDRPESKQTHTAKRKSFFFI